MIVLAVESATIEVGTCLWGEDGKLASFSARPGRRHVETLHPAIEEITAASGIGLSEVDAIGIDVGPGLFTGLRVGIATARALGFALSIPLIGARSTEILHFATKSANKPAIPVIDMRRGEVAWELTAPTRNLAIGTVEQLVNSLADYSGEHRLVGDGARRYFGDIESIANRLRGEELRLVLGEEEFDAPPVDALGEMTFDRLQRGAFGDPADLAPLYLRGPDAKVNFATRQTMADAQHRAVPARTSTTQNKG